MLPPANLLDGLRDDPDDADLVGVYADWLEDQDSRQAHLVRLGAELRRVERAAVPQSDPAYQDYYLRCQALTHQVQAYRLAHQAAWLGPVARVCKEWYYTGGVVTHVTLELLAFVEYGAALLRAHPIRSVRLVDVGRNLRALYPLEEVGAIRALSFRGQTLGPRGAAELADCPSLGRVVSLDLYHNGIDLAGVLALGDGPHLPRLRELNLGYNPLGDDAGRALAAARHWPELHTLNLNGTTIGLAGLLALTRAPERKALVRLAAYLPPHQRDAREVAELVGRFPGVLW